MRRRLGTIVTVRRLGCVSTASVLLPRAVPAQPTGPRRGAAHAAPGGGSLVPDEITTLGYLADQGKLAHDVYCALAGIWSRRLFARIAQAKLEHADVLVRMLRQHGLPDPTEGLEVGHFRTAFGLQRIHDGLVAAGAESRIRALEVGVFLEWTNLEDLAAASLETTHPDLLRIYGQIRAGSVNHLLAFTRPLASQGR